MGYKQNIFWEVELITKKEKMLLYSRLLYSRLWYSSLLYILRLFVYEIHVLGIL